MQFEITGISRITLDYQKGSTKSTHVATDFLLEVDPKMDKSVYLDADGLPTAGGIKPLTAAFVHGLIGSIHLAHEKGYWDSAEHLIYIMEELQRGFATVAKVSKSEM